MAYRQHATPATISRAHRPAKAVSHRPGMIRTALEWGLVYPAVVIAAARVLFF